MPAEMLIGRRLATGALRSAVDAAVGGAGGVVLLGGEAGDVARFARAAFGAHRVPTMTDSSRSGVIALLEEALAALDDQPPAVADGTAPAGTAGAHAARWLLSASLARELADGPDRDLSRAAGLARDAVEGARAAGDAGTLAYALFALADVRWEPGAAAGNPAMSVPLWWNDDGLPIGAHFLGRFGEEATLIRLAAQLEAAQPWAGRRPAVHAARPRVP